MSYLVIKTINGHQYRYRQTSYRVGKKVRTKCVYLGPVKGIDWSATLFAKRSHVDEKELLREVLAKDAKHTAMKDQFFKEVGLRVGPSNPAPVEKEVINPLAEARTAEAPAPEAAAPAVSDAAPADAAPGDASGGSGDAAPA